MKECGCQDDYLVKCKKCGVDFTCEHKYGLHGCVINSGLEKLFKDMYKKK